MIEDNRIFKEGKEIPKHTIMEFGTDLKEDFLKSGGFNKFISLPYVVVRGGVKIYLEDTKLSELRKCFPNYKSSKRMIKRTNKRGTEKKAFSWTCKIVIKGAKSLKESQVITLHNCIKKRRIFKLNEKKHIYHIYDFFFKRADTDEYLYFDEKKHLLVRTGQVSGFGEVSKNSLEEWRKEYLQE